jgi:hypothetical protein
VASLCVAEGGETLEKASAPYISVRGTHMLGESIMGEIGMRIFSRGGYLFTC